MLKCTLQLFKILIPQLVGFWTNRTHTLYPLLMTFSIPQLRLRHQYMDVSYIKTCFFNLGQAAQFYSLCLSQWKDDNFTFWSLLAPKKKQDSSSQMPTLKLQNSSPQIRGYRVVYVHLFYTVCSLTSIYFTLESSFCSEQHIDTLQTY